MSDKPNHNLQPYTTEIVVPEQPDDKYRVQLVHVTDDQQKHRLTLAQYISWGEAEEHLNELQTAMETDGLDAIEDDINRLEEQIHNPLPFTFGEEKQPINQHGEEIIHHIDGGGIVHWFDRVESRTPEQSPYELRYFRAYETDSTDIRHDSYPVMPLAEDDPNLAWPLAGLEMYLEKGDVVMAQQFARDVADTYDQPFPDPMELPSLNPAPEYYFGYGIGPNNSPSLEVVKTWMQGTERQFDTLTVEEYGTFDGAAVDERELEQLKQDKGLEAAMNLAEIWAGANGHLDAERTDPRMFFEDNAPADLFKTDLQKDLIATVDLPHMASELDTEEMPAVQVQTDFDLEDDAIGRDTEWLDAIDHKREQNATLEGADWFEAAFDSDWQLLEPIDDTVNYAVSVHPVDPDTLELAVEKFWRRDDNFIGLDNQTIQTYDIEDELEQAESDRTALLQVHEDRGLQGMMHQAELQAMKNGRLYSNRPGNELFRNGPSDRFETLAQQLEDETNPYWNTDGETIDNPEPEPVENPYWRLETVRVNNPDGEQVGHALQMVVYPNVEQSTDEVGAPDIPDDEPFQMLEMAHFETPEDADKFSKEFRGYLVPGLLDGPELAEEVARLEELPVEWTILEGQDLEGYHNLDYVVTHDADSWKLYNPHAERDARLQMEGDDPDRIMLSHSDINL
jgi:hypothetical protein